MSTAFPNHPEPVQKVVPCPILQQWHDAAVLPSPVPALPASTPILPHKESKKKVKRQLAPAKLHVAWEKVRRVVRDMCRQRGSACQLCQLYGGGIEFQLTAEYERIALDHQDNRILARIGKRQWTIPIVRIKSGGSAYEFRRQRFTATRLIVELLHQAVMSDADRIKQQAETEELLARQHQLLAELSVLEAKLQKRQGEISGNANLRRPHKA